MNKTPLLEFVYNRKKTAATNREAAVELRITFERKQKYMTTGIRLLPKHWHRGAVGKRSAIEILLISKNPVSRMRGKHIPEGRRFSKQTYELILVG